MCSRANHLSPPIRQYYFCCCICRNDDFISNAAFRLFPAADHFSIRTHIRRPDIRQAPARFRHDRQKVLSLYADTGSRIHQIRARMKENLCISGPSKAFSGRTIRGQIKEIALHAPSCSRSTTARSVKKRCGTIFLFLKPVSSPF